MSEQNSPAPEQTLTQAVIDRAKQGDREAMAALYEATQPEIYRTLHAMIRDEDLVLDIQQDCYLKAFSRLDQLREAPAFLPWLRQIAVNEAKAQLRKKKPLLFSELGGEEEGQSEPELPDVRPEASPELALDRRENARLVHALLDKLTDSQRLIMGMYYYEQIPVREIADELGLQPGTVKTQLHRGRKLVETEVRALEAKGVKLYGLSPLPFLLALLKRAEPVEEAGGKALASVLREKGVEAVGLRVGRRFVETAAGKLLLGLLTVGVIGGGVAGFLWLQRRAEPRGDVRPPVLMDSAEDMSTEPTIISSAPTEPATTEPETTAPVTTEPTEPESTEPESTEPTEPEPERTEPSAAPQPPEPSSPVPPQPQPTQPAPTEPEPTEPATQATSVEVLRWEANTSSGENAYGDGPEPYTFRDLPWGSSTRIWVYTERTGSGDPQPRVYSDNPAVADISYLDSFLGGSGSGWDFIIESKGAGTAHITADFGGGEVLVFTVINPEYPETVIRVWAEVETPTHSGYTDSFENCAPGANWRINVIVQGWTEPEITTDNPAVVPIGTLSGFYSVNTSWIHKGYVMTGNLNGTGDAHIYLRLNGTVERLWTVHVREQNVVVTEDPEPEPTDG